MSRVPTAALSESLESKDGFVAPRYRRGQRSADALLEAGRTLLAEINFEALNINDLCAKAALTKGAFYRRFESKDAYFLALQRLALDDAEAWLQTLVETIDQLEAAAPTLSQCAWIVVDGIRHWHLRHRGVVRASLQRRDHTTDGWFPFKMYARGFVEAVSARMIKLDELRSVPDADARLKVAFQIVIGTMINAALNDPGPLHLDDEAMSDALAQMLASYVGSTR